jgi:ABC-type multidrug transport system permease subunit
MIIKIYLNLFRSLKTIFRSWTSLSLLILGPLLIIGLLALAFSSSGFNSVKVGYFTEGNLDLSQTLASLKHLGQFKSYSELDRCLFDLKHQRVHGCIHMRKVGEDRIFTDSYFDNSREVISLIILDNIKSVFLRQEDTLVQTSTEGLFKEVSAMIKFLEESVVSIDGYVEDLKKQRDLLEEAKETVEGSSRTYDTLVKEISTGLTNLRSEKNVLEYQLGNYFYNTDLTLDSSIENLEAANVNLIAADDRVTSGKITDKIILLDANKKNLQNIDTSFDSTINSLDEVFKKMDKLVLEMNNNKYKFNEVSNEIANTIIDIDKKILNLNKIKIKIKENANKFKKIISKGAYVLLNPFEFQYKPLFQGSSRIKDLEQNLDLSPKKKEELSNFGSVQILFPLIIVILICFIAVILSNIIVLDELDSPAYFRSFLLPSSRLVFLLSLIGTAFIITFFQATVLLIVAHYSFFLDILNNLSTILPIIFMIIIIYTFYGMLIAYLLRSRTSSLLVSTFLLIVTFILSGAAFPIERMSAVVSSAASSMPFTIALSMLQQNLFYTIPLYEMIPQVNLLLRHAIFAFLLLLVISHFSERKKIGR